MATTTAVIESLDAPMVDFEYTMQSESMPTDVWYPESTMDDGDMAMDSLVSRDGDEVDMEPRDDTDVEYDMVADEPHEYSTDVIDVEVVDAPPAEPLESLQHVSIAHPISEESVSAIEPAPVPELPEPAVIHVDHASFQSSELATSSTLPLQEPLTNTPLVEHVDYTPSFEASRSAPEQHTLVAEEYPQVNAVEPEPTATEVPSETPLASEFVANIHEPTAAEGDELYATTGAAEYEAQEEYTENDGTTFLPALALPADEPEPVQPTEEHQEPTEEHDISHGNVVADHDTNHGETQQLDGQYQHESTPPILLSLSTSSEPEWTLFSQPGEPSTGAESVLHGEMPLLFQERQELFYEPLINFIEALRQQAAVTQSSGSSEGEMVIDAYDLDLIIAEDNVYSREVTLHDLTMLHQGSRLEGPLRIRVYFTSSRFILRYQELREHVARMNLTDGDNGGGEQQELHDNNELGVGEAAIDNGEGEGEGVREDQANDALQLEREDETEVVDEYHEHGPAHEEPADDQDGPPDDEDHDAADGEVPVLESGNDHETGAASSSDLDPSGQALAAVPVLDADQVHSHDDDGANQGQPEYEEDAEYNEDFDGRYDDDVPEDSGGEFGDQYDEGQATTEPAATEEVHPVADQSADESETVAEATGGEAQGEPSEDNRQDEAQSFAGEASFVEVEELLNHQEDDEDENSTETLSDHHDETYITAYDEPTDERSLDDSLTNVDGGSTDAARPGANVDGEGAATAADIIEPPEDDDDWGEEEQEDVAATLYKTETGNNGSSVTLSSSTTSKRGRGDVDSDDDDLENLPNESPGSKRVRVE